MVISLYADTLLQPDLSLNLMCMALESLSAVVRNLDEVSSTELELPRRFSFLGSCLLKAALQQEARVAFALSLTYESVEASRNSDDNDYVTGLARLLRGATVVCETQRWAGSRFSVDHLVRLRQSGKLDGNCHSDGFRSLRTKVAGLASLEENGTEQIMQLSTEELLHMCFRQSWRCNEEKRWRIIFQQVSLMATLLYKFGQTPQQEQMDDPTFRKEYESISRLFLSLIKSLCRKENESPRRLCMGLGWFICGDALMEKRRLLDESADSSSFAASFFSGAAEALEDCQYGPSHGDKALLAAVVLEYAQLRCAPATKDSARFTKLVKTVVSSRLADDSGKTTDISVRCLRGMLTELQCQVLRTGDTLTATKLAWWSYLVAQSTESLDDAAWFRVVAFTLCSDEELNGLASGMTGHGDESAEFSRVVSAELTGARLRFEIRVGGRPRWGDVEHRLNHVTKLINTSESEILTDWVSSSLLLTRSELCASYGRVEEAIQFAKRCVEKCLVGVQNAHRNFAARESKGSAFPVVAQMLFQRQVLCLQLLASLHDNLGEYRKAEAYAVSAWGVLKKKLPGLKKAKPDLSELLSYTSYSSVLEERCVRRLLEFKCKSGPYERVQRELSLISKGPFYPIASSEDSEELSIWSERLRRHFACKWHLMIAVEPIKVLT